MSDHYLQYQNLIRKVAWHRASNNPNLEFDELMAEGNLAYCEALSTWDPARGRFSTHLWWQLRHRLGAINSKKIDDDNHTLALDHAWEIPGPNNPLESCSFRAGLESLGSEAKEVIDLILGLSGELCDFTMSSVKVTQTNLRKYLRSLKWPGGKINKAMREIKETLRNL